MLATPNIWIADTGATIHNTPHDIGFTEKRTGKMNDSVTVENGAKVESKAIGQIKGTVTTKAGNEIAKVTLQDVALTPNSKFNLLSLMKMMNDGWNMVGNNQHLSISKDNVKIVFDIIIKTQRGQLFCMNI